MVFSEGSETPGPWASKSFILVDVLVHNLC